MKTRLVSHRRPTRIAPWDSPPEIYAQLLALDDERALALRFLILTASRSSQVTNMKWRDIDLHSGVWTLPAARTALEQDQRMPLSKQALSVLSMVQHKADDQFVFALCARPQLRSMMLPIFFRRYVSGSHLQGLQPAFVLWSTKHFPQDAVWLCKSHAPQPDPLAPSQLWGDTEQKRASIMQEWADYATSSAHRKST